MLEEVAKLPAAELSNEKITEVLFLIAEKC